MNIKAIVMFGLLMFSLGRSAVSMHYLPAVTAESIAQYGVSVAGTAVGYAAFKASEALMLAFVSARLYTKCKMIAGSLLLGSGMAAVVKWLRESKEIVIKEVDGPPISVANDAQCSICLESLLQSTRGVAEHKIFSCCTGGIGGVRACSCVVRGSADNKPNAFHKDCLERSLRDVEFKCPLCRVACTRTILAYHAAPVA